MKALGCQPVERYIPFKVLVSDVNLHPYIVVPATVMVTRMSSSSNSANAGDVNARLQFAPAESKPPTPVAEHVGMCNRL